MRETNSNGHEVVYAPRDKVAAINKLAAESDLAAKRDWDRAMLIALLVKRGKRGPKPRVSPNVRGNDQDTITEFTKRGIYGFRSEDAVRAYLKAWELSGQPMPVWGQKIEMPTGEFPSVETLYGRTVDSAGELGGSEDTDPADDTEDEGEAIDEPSSPRPGPNPRSRPEVTMLDKLLTALDSMEPSLVLHGQPTERRALLIKTLESWLDSLREAEAVEEDEEG